jgi:hypothetical protein
MGQIEGGVGALSPPKDRCGSAAPMRSRTNTALQGSLNWLSRSGQRLVCGDARNLGVLVKGLTLDFLGCLTLFPEVLN